MVDGLPTWYADTPGHDFNEIHKAATRAFVNSGTHQRIVTKSGVVPVPMPTADEA